MDPTLTEEDYTQKEILVTRAGEYQRHLESVKSGETSSRKRTRALKSRQYKCKLHHNSNPWADENSSCNSCIRYVHRESLPNGILPGVKHVLEYIMTLKHINTGKHVNTTSICAQDIIMQWVYCNVYATDKRSVEHKIENLLKTVAQLNKFGDRKSDNYWSICTQFLEKQNSLFDIVVDADRKKSQAKLWGVTFDDAFFKNQQKNPPVGYCSTAVDRAWAIQNERKQKRQNRVRSEHYQFERANYDHLDEPSSSSIDVDQDLQNADADWVDDSTEELPPASRKRRIQVNQGDAKNNQELPENYRHIRNSIHNVQPQFYTAIGRMISELHMSKSQAVGASIIIAKEMFNLTWKTSDEDENVIDLDTVPHNFCLRKEGKAREVLALKLIVDKIIESSDKSTFHDDGSRKQGAGKFSV